MPPLPEVAETRLYYLACLALLALAAISAAGWAAARRAAAIERRRRRRAERALSHAGHAYPPPHAPRMAEQTMVMPAAVPAPPAGHRRGQSAATVDGGR